MAQPRFAPVDAEVITTEKGVRVIITGNPAQILLDASIIMQEIRSLKAAEERAAKLDPQPQTSQEKI